ncbi:MAG: hypothetical protein ACWA47_10165 [Brevirhabdus sp.]
MTKTKTILTAALIGAVALTGFSTAPARAGNNNDALAAFLFGATVLAIIAHENDGGSRKRPAIIDQPYKTGTGAGKACMRKRWTEDGWVVYRNKACVAKYNRDYRKPAKRVQRVVKPRECLRQRWTDDGWKKFWSKPCLRRKGFAG